MLLLDWPTTLWQGNPGSELGAEMLAADLDGDGVDELVVGAPGEDTVYVWLGNGAGLPRAPDLALVGAAGSRHGAALTTLDVDGDGVVELGVGAPDTDGGTGAVWLYTSPSSASPTATTVPGLLAGGGFGWSLAAGDLDGDGAEELLVGAPRAAGVGVAYAFAGKLGFGTPVWASSGTSFAASDLAAGDFDGDGFDDAVVNDSSWASVFPGSADGPAATATSMVSDAYEFAVADFDGDGFDDLLAQYDVVTWGSSAGLPSASLSGWSDSDLTAAAGDLDGDGRPEGFQSACSSLYGASGCGPTLVWGGSRAAGAPLFVRGYSDSALFSADLGGTGVRALVLGASEEVVAYPLVDDADGDGWSPDDPLLPDCEDADAEIRPMAADVPDDGIDQDCSGADSAVATVGECEFFTDWATVEAWYLGDSTHPRDPNALLAEVDALAWTWERADEEGCQWQDECRTREWDVAAAGAATFERHRRTVTTYSLDWDGELTSSSTWELSERAEVPDGTPSGVLAVQLTEEGESYHDRHDIRGMITLADAGTTSFVLETTTDRVYDYADGSLNTEHRTHSWTLGECSGSVDHHKDWQIFGQWGYVDDGLHEVEWAAQAACSTMSDLWISWDGQGRAYTKAGATLTWTPPTVDEDGDGFGPDEDCDDHDATRHPCTGDVIVECWIDADGDGHGDAAGYVGTGCACSAGQAQDGEDCDDADPERVTLEVWYPDADGDGFGDAGRVESVCQPPEGWTLNGDDCDDTDAAVNPAAEEDCAEVDRNCDGDATAGAPVDPLLPDADGDGHGSAHAAPELRCPGPDWAASDDDCDDHDAAVYPGATEVRGDGVDQDCDGSDTRRKRRPETCATGSSDAPLLAAAVALTLLARRRPPGR